MSFCLEEQLPTGALWRDGKLVRIDRDATLPARCIVCNQPAARRIARTLYYSPLGWRIGAFVAPFVILWLGLQTGELAFLVAFWPSVIILFIAHFFVRKKVRLELGACPRHWRVRLALQAVSVVATGLVFLALFNFHLDTSGRTLALAAGAVIVLAVAQSYVGLQAVAAQRLTDEHAWLGRTGKPFREALPELPGA